MMDSELYKPDYPKNVVDTAPGYLECLASYYRDRVVVPRRTPQEVIGLLRDSYALCLEETSLAELDPVTASVMSNLDDSTEKPEKLWRLERTASSRIFYADFDRRNQNPVFPLSICVIYRSKSDRLRSNSLLLESFMICLRGIEWADVQNKSPEYKAYLNTLYGYNRQWDEELRQCKK